MKTTTSGKRKNIFDDTATTGDNPVEGLFQIQGIEDNQDRTILG